MKKFLLAFGVTFALLLTMLVSLGDGQVSGQSAVTTFSNLRVNQFYRTQPRTVLDISMNGTINATGGYQPISGTTGSAVHVSGDSFTVEPAGTIVTLINTGAQNIVITETANIKSAGNLTLGTLDAATFLSNGTDWYQVSASNN